MPDWIRQHPAGWFTLVVMGGGFTLYVTNRLHAAGMLAWAVVMLVCIMFGPAVDEVVGGRWPVPSIPSLTRTSRT